jgi:hypothetical protein
MSLLCPVGHPCAEGQAFCARCGKAVLRDQGQEVTSTCLLCNTPQDFRMNASHHCTGCGAATRLLTCPSCSTIMRTWKRGSGSIDFTCAGCSAVIPGTTPTLYIEPASTKTMATAASGPQNPAPVQHLLHLGLCIITAGLWLPVYAFTMVSYSLKKNMFDNARAAASSAGKAAA